MQWEAHELGGGIVKQGEETISLTIPVMHQGYADAQIDDTQALPRRAFKWKPPSTMSVEARVIPGSPKGTFGFGFWNDPFSLSIGQRGASRKFPTTPQAIWFFYGSTPNDMQLTRTGGGAGWKAIVINSPKIPGILSMPFAGAGIALAQLPLLRMVIIRMGQKLIRAREIHLELELNQWHSYEISWIDGEARLGLDGAEVLCAPFAGKGPLGFVAWMDNQYAVASEEDGIRFGVLQTHQAQSLELRCLRLYPESGPLVRT